MKPPKIPTAKRLRRTAIGHGQKPRSLDYYKGIADCLQHLSALVIHGPIFLQVLAVMAGQDISVPGVEKHTREQFEKEFKASMKPQRRKQTPKETVQ